MTSKPIAAFQGDQKQSFLGILKELSSAGEQRRLWLSNGSSGEVSSFAEAFEGLFTDIDIYKLAEAGMLGNPEIMVRLLGELEALLQKVDHRVSDQEKITDFAMVPVREKALQILDHLPNDFDK